MTLAVDRQQINRFASAIFRYANAGGYLSLRSFVEGGPSLAIKGIQINGDLSEVAAAAHVEAQRAASHIRPAVFCPPLATFTNQNTAKEEDVAEAFTLSVECDQQPAAACAALETVIGAPTLIVESGGEWTDPQTGEIQPKLHLHWRLTEPASGEDLAKLKQARRLAAALVGGDPTNVPVVHPIRWPGSWHRKGQPRLTRMISIADTIEIDLWDALDRLKEACPDLTARSTNDTGAREGEPGDRGHGDLVCELVEGKNLHANIAALAARMVGAGMVGGAVVNHLRGVMQASRAARDARWQARYDDIPRAVRTAEEKFGWPREASTEAAFSQVLDPWEEFLVPPFPLDTLPPVLRAYVDMQAKSTGGDEAAIAMSALTACSGALDLRFMVKMKETGGWRVRPRLWTLLVGDPSSKKTPITAAAVDPLRTLEEGTVGAYHRELARWKADKRNKDVDEGEEPDKPTRYVLNSITAEKLADILGRQDRGVLALADELSGFLGSMDKYSGSKGAGADRAMWLVAYNGGSYAVDRMSRGEQFVKNLAVSFLAGVQPERLEAMKDLTSDGLLQRFLPVMMTSSNFPQEVESDEPAEAFEGLIRVLAGLHPATLGISVEARAYFDDFQRQIYRLERECTGVSSGFISFLGKLTGVQGSLALLLHLAADPRESLYDRVSATAAEAATRILREFVLPHADALYRRIEGGANLDPVRELASYILTSKKDRFTASDFTSNVWRLRGVSSLELSLKISPLVAGGWLDEITGTVPVKAWTLKAGLREHFVHRAQSERERKAAAAQEMSAIRRRAA